MFDTIAPTYELVNHLMTFGLDAAWRRRTAALLGLPPGARVCDLACGTGSFLAALKSSDYQMVGVDLSANMLRVARVHGVPLIEVDASELPFPDASFDGVISGFALRNFTDLGATFAEIGRVLRPGGRVALLDVAEPSLPLLKEGHRLYFNHVVPYLGGLFSDRAAYRYLPRSVAYLPSTAELVKLARAGGLEDVRHRRLSGGITQVLTATGQRL
jgi:demethylmenaquinone methyltransferase/2-methoxy-6-polyprenyl-1,4-benzoquinol methylase